LKCPVNSADGEGISKKCYSEREVEICTPVRQCERDKDRGMDTNLHKQSCSHASPKIEIIVLAFKVCA
jgi:hypothetical protein